jgi:hypothetical protein
MTFAEVRRVAWHWCRFAIRDSAAQAFGWPTVASAVMVAYLLKRAGVVSSPNTVENNLAIAAGSWLIALAFYVFTAAFKAYRLVRPLALTITDDIRSPDFSFNEKARGYNVAVVVSNRSVMHLKDCVAYVMDVPDHDGAPRPRFVEKFDLPPKSKKNVFVAYWFSRVPPNPDDKDIGITGTVSASFGGNICRVPAETIISIKIQAQETDSKNVRCRVWIDQTSRRLRGIQLAD